MLGLYGIITCLCISTKGGDNKMGTLRLYFLFPSLRHSEESIEYQRVGRSKNKTMISCLKGLSWGMIPLGIGLYHTHADVGGNASRSLQDVPPSSRPQENVPPPLLSKRLRPWQKKCHGGMTSSSRMHPRATVCV